MSALSTAKRAAKRGVKRAFASPWGWRIAGPLVRAPGVIVMMYHRINGADRSLTGLPVESFAAQMRWLRDNCDPIHPDELVARARRARRGREARPAVLITFDDGYRDYHDRAYPVLKALGIPAVVFLATSFVDGGGYGLLWTEQLQWAAQSTTRARVRLPWSGETIILDGQESRAAMGAKARQHLKGLPDGERRAAMEALLAELGDPPARGREMLTWDEVRATMDLTVYGGHSHTHPILSRLDRAEAEREIRTCRERIVDETGRAPRYFAYPNGKPSDFTPETQELLRRHGFEIAFATSEGIAGPDSDWMAVKRLPGDVVDLAEFVWLAAGLSRS
jgi:peptidoglycan/xylan/chitin deacetylase (PgdA/CDA1 family)